MTNRCKAIPCACHCQLHWWPLALQPLAAAAHLPCTHKQQASVNSQLHSSTANKCAMLDQHLLATDSECASWLQHLRVQVGQVQVGCSRVAQHVQLSFRPLRISAAHHGMQHLSLAAFTSSAGWACCMFAVADVSVNQPTHALKGMALWICN